MAFLSGVHCLLPVGTKNSVQTLKDQVKQAKNDCNQIVMGCKGFANNKIPYTYTNKTHKDMSNAEFCTALAATKGKVYCNWDDSNATSPTCDGVPLEHMAFSQFCGILLASFIYFCIYNVYMQGFQTTLVIAFR
jgi:hypothetical protein